LAIWNQISTVILTCDSSSNLKGQGRKRDRAEKANVEGAKRQGWHHPTAWNLELQGTVEQG
jgi:hypothetical protein